MRQHCIQLVIRVREQTGEHIFQIGIGIVASEPGRLNQAHDDGRPLAGTLRACKQSILATNGHRPDLLFNVIVINRNRAIVNVTGQRPPGWG